MIAKDRLVSQEEDFNEWYNTLVLKADLADYGPVRGTMIVKPYGWALWENIQRALDRRFKATGVENAAFPLFIPMELFRKEAVHVAGFAPELAVVTHGGGKELGDPLVVRPSSEALVNQAFARWVQSYRDLPLLLNMWNSVVRWELRTRLFLRSLEFHWQEGHTAHATEQEARERTRQMLDVYAEFALDEAALPVISGVKSELERFAGAQETLTIEAMMRDGKALQSGTSHYFGQNFSRVFDVQFVDASNTQQYCYTTSWGLSTRFIGAIIMTHGDDRGLILPPRLAPYQVVLVPIYRSDGDKGAVMETVQRLSRALADAGISTKIDDRENLSPGFKFNAWELKGVPVRIDVGAREVAEETVVLARRDRPGRAGKQTVAQDSIVQTVQELLRDIHHNLVARAGAFMNERTHVVTSYDQFKEVIETGFARVWWAGDNEDELRVKEETRATLRCFPLEQPDGSGRCFYTGRMADRIAIFGRAY